MSEAATIPPIRTQYSNEDIVWENNVVDILVYPQLPTIVSTILIDRTTNTTISLPDPPTIIGTSLFQRVRSTLLTSGHLYRLVFIFTPSGTSNIVDSILTINCLGF